MHINRPCTNIIFQVLEMQTILVLVGVPGSGKTTVSLYLHDASPRWTWINQDTLGDRKRCESALKTALARGEDVIVDRCNHTTSQRQTWVQLAFEMQSRTGSSIRLICLALEMSPSLCKSRAVQRTGHATLSAADAPAVIDRFLSEYQPPSINEGFHQVFRVASPQQLQHVLNTQLMPWRGVQGQQQQHYTAPVTPHAYSHSMGAPSQPGFQYQRLQQHHVRSVDSMYIPRSEQAAGGHPHDARGLGPTQDHDTSVLQAAGEHGHRNVHPLHVWSHDRRVGNEQLQLQGMKQHHNDVAAGSAQQAAAHAVGAPSSCHVQHHDHHIRPQRTWPSPSAAEHHAAGQQCEQQHKANIVPFGRQPSAAEDGHHRPGHQFLDQGDDPRPIVLWDMNGTLTSHTHARRSTGRNIARPGTHHLRRLATKFRVGVFTSASKRTVSVAVDMLEKQAGEGPRIFDPALLLHRVHTEPAPQTHMAAGGKAWDTVKPLHKYFKNLHRVILMDDDAYKALASEQGNMLHVPCWEDEDPQDQMIQHFVDTLLQVFGSLPPQADVREHTSLASKLLFDTARRLATRQMELQAEQQIAGDTPSGLSEPGNKSPGTSASSMGSQMCSSPGSSSDTTSGRGGTANTNPEEIQLDI